MSNSLYEQLKAGTSAEDIAAAFAAELNKAEEQLRAEREAEEKAKAERVSAKLAEEAAKIDEATDLLRNLVAFISHYYPSFGLEDANAFTEDEYRAIAELILLMLDLEATKPAKRQVKPTTEVKADKPTLDDPFADFFKTFGL